MENKGTKLLYFPLFQDEGTPGSHRGDDVRIWIERFLLPAGVVTNDEDKANAYLVVGGDGTLMRKVRNRFDSGKIFVGINRGTVGFMLNPISQINDIPLTIGKLNFFELKLMRVTFYTKIGEEKSFYAFNDVVVGGRKMSDYTTFNITGSMNHFPARSVTGYGIIISTPQGTTGFALKARGSNAILPIDSNCWYITGVATGPYPCDQISPQTVVVEINSRGQVNGYADGESQEANNIVKVVIESTNNKVTLGFLADIDFAARRTQLAHQVERGEI